jgi:hypothetical protein
MRSGAVEDHTRVRPGTRPRTDAHDWTHDDVEAAVDQTLIILLLLPILVIELVLIVVALRDLLRPERRVRGDSKLMWGLLIVFIGMLGPILYLTVGREQE